MCVRSIAFFVVLAVPSLPSAHIGQDCVLLVEEHLGPLSLAPRLQRSHPIFLPPPPCRRRRRRSAAANRPFHTPKTNQPQQLQRVALTHSTRVALASERRLLLKFYVHPLTLWFRAFKIVVAATAAFSAICALFFVVAVLFCCCAVSC